MRTISLGSLLLVVACGPEHPGPGADRPAPSDELGACCGNNAALCPAPVGGAPDMCAPDSDCRGVNHAVGDDFPGGFCTQACAKLADCPDGTVCVDTDGNGDPTDGFCVYPCATHDDCDIAGGGTGYRCLRKFDFERDWYMVCMGQ